MTTSKHADILIAGAGLAGLSLALECARRPEMAEKKILLLEKDRKDTNDRTWCFWAKEEEILPPVRHKSWSKCRFYTNNGQEIDLEMGPYRYHMIRGIDYYQWAMAELAQHPNVQIQQAEISAIDAKTGEIHTDMGIFSGTKVFNAALRQRLDDLNKRDRFARLLQHFKGWIIETEKPAFDPESVTFMDYRLEQGADTRFVYVLPFSDTRALVEYTVFSPSVWEPNEYDRELRNYVENQLHILNYKVEETEFGVIPMTDVPLKNREGRVVHIGTAGGFVKGSSGYAFLRTQRKIRHFVHAWAQEGRFEPESMQSNWRFRFYDSILLQVLQKNRVPGSVFFSRLFTKLPAWLVWKFLDEDSTFAEDLRLLQAPPTWPFARTALEQLPVLKQI